MVMTGDNRQRGIRGITDAQITNARKAVGGTNDSETIRNALDFAAEVGPRVLEAQRTFGSQTPARAVQLALDFALTRAEGAGDHEQALRLILRFAQVALGDFEPARPPETPKPETPPPAALQAPARVDAADSEDAIWASAINLRGLGIPLRFIGRYLSSRGIKPPRGGDWHNQQVKFGLVRAGYDWDANEKGGEE